MPKCSFADGNIPKWYLNYMKSKEKELELEEQQEELLDDGLKEKLIKNVPNQTLMERLLV